MNKKLQANLDIVLYLAEKYAEGDRYDLENFEEARENILKEIEKLEEYKWKYKDLCK